MLRPSGLKNYNILHNPQYKEAFGITWKFAFENKTVRSVRQMKSKAQASAEEDDAAKIEALQRKYIKVAEEHEHHKLARSKSSNRGFATSFYAPVATNANTAPAPAPKAKANNTTNAKGSVSSKPAGSKASGSGAKSKGGSKGGSKSAK